MSENETRLPALIAGHKPQAIVPHDMDTCYRLAKAVCYAGMAPRGLDTPEKAMVAIMHGLEIGLTPMAALQRIAVVNGRPTIWGDGAMGLVRASGLCESIDESIDGAGEAMNATCIAFRKGQATPITGEFSVADAKKAGLWGKSGPWQQYPKRMLQMRARAFCLRDGFADVLGGLYLREEIDEEQSERRPYTKRQTATPPDPDKQEAEEKKLAETYEKLAKTNDDRQAKADDYARKNEDLLRSAGDPPNPHYDNEAQERKEARAIAEARIAEQDKRRADAVKAAREAEHKEQKASRTAHETIVSHEKQLRDRESAVANEVMGGAPDPDAEPEPPIKGRNRVHEAYLNSLVHDARMHAMNGWKGDDGLQRYVDGMSDKDIEDLKPWWPEIKHCADKADGK
jgi:RecT family